MVHFSPGAAFAGPTLLPRSHVHIRLHGEVAQERVQSLMGWLESCDEEGV